MSVIGELLSDNETDRDDDFILRVNRLIHP